MRLFDVSVPLKMNKKALLYALRHDFLKTIAFWEVRRIRPFALSDM